MKEIEFLVLKVERVLEVEEAAVLDQPVPDSSVTKINTIKEHKLSSSY